MKCRDVKWPESLCSSWYCKWEKAVRCPSCILSVICSFTALRGSWHSGNFHSTGNLTALILQLFTDPSLSGSLQPGANFNHPLKEVLSIVVSCTCECLWVLFLLSFWNANSLSPPDVTCGSSESSCKDGSCVPSSAWCNQVIDCADASDEKSCSKSFSLWFAFQLP